MKKTLLVRWALPSVFLLSSIAGIAQTVIVDRR